MEKVVSGSVNFAVAIYSIGKVVLKMMIDAGTPEQIASYYVNQALAFIMPFVILLATIGPIASFIVSFLIWLWVYNKYEYPIIKKRSLTEKMGEKMKLLLGQAVMRDFAKKSI